jgi:hypothetical protein
MKKILSTHSQQGEDEDPIYIVWMVSEHSKMFLFFVYQYYIWIIKYNRDTNRLFKTLFYPENIWVLKKEILEITLNFYSTT